LTALASIEQVFDTGKVVLAQGLTQSVSDDDIAAEFAASWASTDDDFPGKVPLEPAVPRRSALRPLERRRAGDPRDLLEAAERVRPVSLAREQVLPVAPVLGALLPDGLPRGSSVAVTGSARGGGGSTAVAFALAAAPSSAGSWVATVGLPGLGLAAAAEIGVALERLAVISTPPPDRWATVVASLVGAFDIILVAPPPESHVAEARRLVARARERGSVLIQLDPRDTGRANALDVDLRVVVVGAQWYGLGEGHGRLRARRLEVEVTGRRRAARPRRSDVWLLDAEGQARPVELAELAELDELDALGEVTERTGRTPSPEDTFAGSDVGHLIAARRLRLQRAAREPLPASRALPDAAVADDTWSDAG